MPGPIQIADLNNAKTDVDHIAEFANSTAHTAVDRLGATKPTLAGLIADAQAATAAAEALMDEATGEVATAAATATTKAAEAAAAADAAEGFRDQAEAIVLGDFLQNGVGAEPRTFPAKARDIINIEDFVTGAMTNHTVAFQSAAGLIESLGGGAVWLYPGKEYTVGAQTFAGATGQGYAYLRSDSFKIEGCAKPVVIEGSGARIKLADGLRYGSFDPVTGAAHSPTLPFTDPDYMADAGALIDLRNNASVTVRDVELDGNIESQLIGGSWGDSGIQLFNPGLYLDGNEQVLVQNVHAHHCGLDNVEVVNTGLTDASEPRPHVLMSVRSRFAGRQALSIVGCNSFTAIGCDFSETGQNSAVSSGPGCGIDIEPESSICKNLTFIRCRMHNNAGVAMVCDVDDGRASDITLIDCELIGVLGWSLWMKATRFKMIGGRVVGPCANIRGDSDASLAAKFIGVLMSMTAADSPTGAIATSSTRMELDGAENVLFQRCNFTADSTHELPFSPATVIYDSCTFSQESTSTNFTAGVFEGRNVMTTAGTWDASSSVMRGQLVVNGVDRPQLPYIVDNLGLRVQADIGSGLTDRRMTWHYNPAVWAASVGGARESDVVWNVGAGAGGKAGWFCITAGNPGTWKPFGAIDA